MFDGEDGTTKLGVVTGDGVIDVAEAAKGASVAAPATMMDVIDGGEAIREQLRAIASSVKATLREEDLRFAPPLSRPGKIVCVGTNYRQHAMESNLPIPTSPVYFAKYANSLTGHRSNVEIPASVNECDYEVELVVVIGRRTKHVERADALASVLGYATGNDLSARDLQFRNSQWLYGKAIDGFSPLGPYLVTADEVPDVQNLGLKCWVNGELRQDSNTSDMIFSVADIVADLSQIMTLEPGDLIYTGTPQGVALGMASKPWLRRGDVIVCEVEGLGKLESTLV